MSPAVPHTTDESVADPNPVGTRRAEQWAATMAGHGLTADEAPELPIRHAHADGHTTVTPRAAADRQAREDLERLLLVEGATLSEGAGHRAHEEAPDPRRTCFERDRDRILHGTTAFRRLAGKTQVFIFPEDHQRTRLTHALEVAQVATAISAAARAQRGPHRSHRVGSRLRPRPPVAMRRRTRSARSSRAGTTMPSGVPTWCSPRSTCAPRRSTASATTAGHAPHRPHRRVRSCRGPTESRTCATTSRTPSTPASSRRTSFLPWSAIAAGASRSRQLGAFIGAMVDTIAATGHIAMDEATADALAAFRRFNYERIYMRPASIAQSESVIRVLRALVEYYADRPNTLPFDDPRHAPAQHTSTNRAAAGSEQAVHDAVAYVAGMTDRFRLQLGHQPAGLGTRPPSRRASASADPRFRSYFPTAGDGKYDRNPCSGDENDERPGQWPGRSTRSMIGSGQSVRTSTSFLPLRDPNFTLAGGEGEERVVAAAADVDAGVDLVPRWRTMIEPALTTPPSNTFTPRRLDSESRPFLVEPPPLVFDMSAQPFVMPVISMVANV